MIAAIVSLLLPMCTGLRICAAGDIVRSLTSFKKHESELKFFVSFFRKTPSNQNIKSSKVATLENCEIFSDYYFSYVRDYKATLAVNLLVNYSLA